ncbi:helicase-related protein [uncultured Sanguibacteroides sp.]|uniref:helicase-related protein n=1 Tax=uncultured Sanguibacteroides sp. TaxID=1635151 RepID=UPI0025D43BE8|nr:helicase-related protein [uncultured Sanguibacteroides sp.]
MNANREMLITRITKELIGPGSDIFECGDKVNYSDEIIEGKPLQRYFSGILYPKQYTKNGNNNISEEDDINEVEDTKEDSAIINETDDFFKQEECIYQNAAEDEKEEVQYVSNTFFPSQYGISFVVSKECSEINVSVSFGCYKKAKSGEVALSYDGDDIDLLSRFGLDKFVDYDCDRKLLRLSKELTKSEKKARTECQYQLWEEHRNSQLYKTLSKLFFKDKYKRINNELTFKIPLEYILKAENRHYKCLLADANVNVAEKWWRGKINANEILLKDNLWLHVVAYPKDSRYFLKVIVENTLQYPKDKFSLAKEIMNQLCLFQVNIRIDTPFLKSFNNYKDILYKSTEDKMLDYLYRNKMAYGVGHNTSCVWENCEKDESHPTWISSSFLPQYNVKSQSTDIEDISKDVLVIKELSSFNNNKTQIIENLKSLSVAYEKWIANEQFNANGNEWALRNGEKCVQIKERMNRGIELLNSNNNAMRAFQLANAAIYLQMFRNEIYFSKKRDGYEPFEQHDFFDYSYEDYAHIQYPDLNKIPAWRPFQLAFILQCLPSFIEENTKDRELVDLLYFPTGGGKTEAYLAVSAFLIFWRRLQYPKNYGGVNVIVRYTLRLLSAQQFERATKLILACEFIRQSHTDLGSDKITIGFWVGDSTIPNNIKKATVLLTKVQDRLNKKQAVINPFQVSNCQWCNTKVIGRMEAKANGVIGHRILHNRLTAYCLNPECSFSERKGGFPIVLIDEDIYSDPPTMLFATVDKFAQLAWKGEATTLFNHGKNRKPELIIQDELHLLNGPLGSMVGLFENVVLNLCTTPTQAPKLIASTATIKNVDKQIAGLYGKSVRIFPQNITSADDSFFSKTQENSKRRYVGILPTGKTFTMANLRLNAALIFARLEIWQNDLNKVEVDQFWTILSYFKSLKNIGRFSNKIASELIPEIKQLQVRYLMNQVPYNYNYNKLSYRNLELTSRIPNEQIKRNLDKLSVAFDGNLAEHQAFDLVLATNMISVGLDIGRLNVMLINGMPPNTAEYIQASSRVARQREGIVCTLLDPNNTRDLSYFEDFISFHKTFYKQVEPLSVTPFAENALDKMLFTLMVTYFRHKMGFSVNNMADALQMEDIKAGFVAGLKGMFNDHLFINEEDKSIVFQKINNLIQDWLYKIDASPEHGLFFYGGNRETEKKKNLLIPIQEKQSEDDIRVAMQSMRNVEPSAIVVVKKQ